MTREEVALALGEPVPQLAKSMQLKQFADPRNEAKVGQGPDYGDDDDDDEEEEEEEQGRPRTFCEIPDLTRARALTRLLAVLGQDEFPPADDAGVAELARRWEADIDNERHPIAEVRQWHLYRIRHFYDAPTTQRLINDPYTATWIADERAAAMDTG
jgi:hypothetical protein